MSHHIGPLQAKVWACDGGPDMHPGLAMIQDLYGEDMYDFVRQLLHPDQHQRPSAAQALETPFLKRLAAEEVSQMLASVFIAWPAKAFHHPRWA